MARSYEHLAQEAKRRHRADFYAAVNPALGFSLGLVAFLRPLDG